ncbi:hypothetical protein VTK73DRAFT_9678 [Phialemonium thermophilum]|uniref:Major facilitator superfamily (MFS) profile domain-containing protein n=1 Tax=Phialemonium thermophilum TaxID=223376 RepID=A0ABR3W0Y4_9PEZI
MEKDAVLTESQLSVGVECTWDSSPPSTDEQPSRAIHTENLVDWEGPHDPQNPQNWPSGKRWGLIVLVSAITFNQCAFLLPAMASTIFAPGVPQAMRDLHSSAASSPAVATLLVSIFVIGLAVGPLFLAPLSELYGRVPLMHASNVAFLVAAVLAAVSVNIPMLIVARLAMGASTISLGGGYATDLMEPEMRGRAMNVWTVGPVLAPVVGPIAGGFISLRTTWRWTFGLVAIVGAVAAIVCFFFLPETYPPRLLQRKAARLRAGTGNMLLRSRYDSPQTPAQLLRASLVRPTRMLLGSPMLGIVSVFLAVAYSYMYLMFTTFTEVFEAAYGFDPGHAGLAYLGLGIGSLVGQYTYDVFVVWRRRRRLAQGHHARRPEDHLPPLLAAGLLLSVGLFWYGWALEYRVHWVVPIVGTGVCGVAITYFFLAVQTYLIEAFTLYAASALAANTVVRCVFGVTVPLAGPSLYSRLGLGWGNSLLGFLALAVVPASLWLLRNGERIRSTSRFDAQV